jgi:hypothetical protein
MDLFYTYLLCGTTVPVELCPPHVLYVRVHDNKFLQSWVISPMPNPQHGVPISLSLAPPLKPVWHEWP